MFLFTAGKERVCDWEVPRSPISVLTNFGRSVPTWWEHMAIAFHFFWQSQSLRKRTLQQRKHSAFKRRTLQKKTYAFHPRRHTTSYLATTSLRVWDSRFKKRGDADRTPQVRPMGTVSNQRGAGPSAKSGNVVPGGRKGDGRGVILFNGLSALSEQRWE